MTHQAGLGQTQNKSPSDNSNLRTRSRIIAISKNRWPPTNDMACFICRDDLLKGIFSGGYIAAFMKGSVRKK